MIVSEPSQPAVAKAKQWLWGLLLIAGATSGFALAAGSHFRPKVGYVSDFTQDWLSAREVIANRPPYGDLWAMVRQQFHGEPPTDFLQWNAHPPASILLVLPLGFLRHEIAFFVWNLATFPLFVVAVWIVMAELAPWNWRRGALAALAIGAVGITCFPLLHQVVMGQFNALLAFLIAVAWASDRRGWWLTAGLAVGFAAAIKLFPAFLFLYLLGTRRWRTVGVAVAVIVAVNAVALGVFGFGAYRTYAFEVVPAVSAKYATQWNNLSLQAFWLRLFDPTPESRIVAVAHLPLLGKLLGALSRFAVIVLTGLAAWRATSLAARDRAFALAVTGMILVSPIAWPHYLIMLAVPIGVLGANLYRSAWRWPLVACVAVMWLPDTFTSRVAFGPEFVEQMSIQRHSPLSPVHNLLIVSVLHYAVLGAFLLTLRLPVSSTEGERASKPAENR